MHQRHTLKQHKLISLLLVIFMITPIWADDKKVPEELEKKPGGIRTEFGDVLIENLGIGQTYNLRELAGQPFSIKNTGEWSMDLRIDSLIPEKGMVEHQGRWDKGFRPVPSADWVTVTQSQFLLPSGQNAYTDVIISIPDDPKYYGKKFMASLFSRSVDKRFLNLGVWSHILFTIVPSEEAQKKLLENRKRGIVENMEYTLIPDKIVILNAPIGRKMNILDEIGKTIKIANSGANDIDLRMTIVEVGSTPLSLQPGYDLPKSEWLTLKQKEAVIKSATFYDPGLVLELPNDPDLKGRKLMFVMKVEPADPDVIGVTFYGKIYVEVVE